MGKGEIACYSFYHNVFKSCLLLMRQNEYLWSEGLISVFRVSVQNAVSRSICR